MLASQRGYVRQLARFQRCDNVGRPGVGGDVGNAVFIGQIFMIGQSPVENAQQLAAAFVEIFQCDRRPLLGAIGEVIQKEEYGTKLGRLPEQPLQRLAPLPLRAWQQPPRLFGEVEKDRAGLEHDLWREAGAIDDHRYGAGWAQCEEFGRQTRLVVDIDIDPPVIDVAFLEHDRNLADVRSRD